MVPAVDLPENPQKFSQNPPREAACVHLLRPSAGQSSGALSLGADRPSPSSPFTFLCDLSEAFRLQAARPPCLLWKQSICPFLTLFYTRRLHLRICQLTWGTGVFQAKGQEFCTYTSFSHSGLCRGLMHATCSSAFSDCSGLLTSENQGYWHSNMVTSKL